MSEPVKVSVVIKALNEEERIATAIQTALDAVAVVGGEVILADSCSTDRTIEIAKEFPITIVQLKNANEKRCGVGPQLGYQVAKGDYIYILDGDMELDPEFFPKAIEALEGDPELAGVAGIIDEMSDASYQFRGRKRRGDGRESGEGVGCLEMGGLYRRVAIEQVGYFSDRNLHAFEELDLGLRLTNAGWKLRRLGVRSVVHYGWEEGNWTLMKRRWRSHYADGGGEMVREALGKPWFGAAAMTQKHLYVGILIWAALIVSAVRWDIGLWLLPLTLVGVLSLMIMRFVRSGSFGDAAFAQVAWQVNALAFIRGFFSRKADPRQPLDYIQID